MRLPVTPALSTKDGSANKNARMTNVLREKNKAVIRPGLSAVLDYAGLGAGLIPFNGRLIAIFDDTIYADNNVGAAPDVAFPLDSLPWSAATTYTFGDSVWYNGVLWFSIASGNTNNTPASGAWWASSYPPAWNSGYTYPAGAFVNYSGYLWESLQADNLNNTPELESDYWESPNPPVAGYALVISVDTQDYNVYNAFVAAYGSPPASVTLSVTVDPSVIVSSTSVGTAALTWDSTWSGAPTFTLVNNGYIVGKGGTGGASAIASDGSVGNAGGKALELSGQAVSITNASGFIWGGGGGGGAGGGATMADVVFTGLSLIAGGGGGGGAGAGVGGVADTDFVSGSFSLDSAAGNGSAPSGALSVQLGGLSGSGGIATGYGLTVTGGNGGNGGDYAATGSTGSDGTTAGSPFGSTGVGAGAIGGAAGKAINLSSGTANFINGSGSPNVKGSVS